MPRRCGCRSRTVACIIWGVRCRRPRVVLWRGGRAREWFPNSCGNVAGRTETIRRRGSRVAGIANHQWLSELKFSAWSFYSLRAFFDLTHRVLQTPTGRQRIAPTPYGLYFEKPGGYRQSGRFCEIRFHCRASSGEGQKGRLGKRSGRILGSRALGSLRRRDISNGEVGELRCFVSVLHRIGAEFEFHRYAGLEECLPARQARLPDLDI